MTISEGAARWFAAGVIALCGLAGVAVSWRQEPRPLAVNATVVPARETVGETSHEPETRAEASPVQPEATPKQVHEHVAASSAGVGVTRIDLNRATQAELELLPGIGPSLAQRILDYRAEHGAFKRIEDLDEVKGIGPKTLEKLRPLVRVDPIPSPEPGSARTRE